MSNVSDERLIIADAASVNAEVGTAHSRRPFKDLETP